MGARALAHCPYDCTTSSGSLFMGSLAVLPCSAMSDIEAPLRSTTAAETLSQSRRAMPSNTFEMVRKHHGATRPCSTGRAGRLMGWGELEGSGAACLHGTLARAQDNPAYCNTLGGGQRTPFPANGKGMATEGLWGAGAGKVSECCSGAGSKARVAWRWTISMPRSRLRSISMPCASGTSCLFSATSLLSHETVGWCHPFSRVIFGATASRSRL
eukprot:5137222-Prymnesium_polylepis.1